MHLTAARKIRASQNFERTELTEYEKIGFYVYWRLDNYFLELRVCWRRVRSTRDFGRVGRSLCPDVMPA